MGRKKHVQKLKVYLEKQKIGFLTRRADGSIEFRYDEEWIDNGYAISLSLPLPDRVFIGERASFYFDNLLPDSTKILEAIARKFEVPSTKSFDILAAVGRDCIGALSFFHEEEDPELTDKMQVRLLSDSDIAHRLRGLSSDSPLGMDDGDVRLSLAGAQEKMALLYRKGKWWEPRGATPTSHILKRSMGTLMKNTTVATIDFQTSVDNEWISLYLARACDISAAKADISIFEDQRVLSVERFDRIWKENILRRIPQEDFCQATGTSPILKYERKGGPSLRKMMTILLSSNNATADRRRFFKTALFNDLIHNTDSHAKNFSIFQLRAGFALTPMYDLLSAHFLYKTHSDFYSNLRSSLSVNGKEKFHEITADDWRKEADHCGLGKKICDELMHELALAVKSLDVPIEAQPPDLDKHQVESILEGIHRRARILL